MTKIHDAEWCNKVNELMKERIKFINDATEAISQNQHNLADWYLYCADGCTNDLREIGVK